MTSKVLVYLALAVFAGVAYAEKDLPLLVKTFKNLNRGPPVITSIKRATVLTKTIEQKLDHFDDTNTATYQMRYMINDEFQKDGSPIFIYCGGEWEISPGMISAGHWYDLAQEHSGLLVYSEHRYYGKSFPTSDLSVENLKYLHVKQALADLAHLIKTLKSENPQLANSKVLLAGGSYSATMVVWFKRLYPELIVGGFASSAPLLAKVDFKEYKEVVGKSLRVLGGERCYNHVQQGIAGLEALFDNGRSAEARAMLRLCNTFNEQNDLDVWSLFGSISNVFASIAQYQQNDDVEFYCNFLLSTPDPVVSLANFLYLSWGQPSCIDATYQSTMEYYNWAIENLGESRSWYYQTCNEYGWYQSSASADQPFGRKFPAILYTTLCSDIFGKDYTNEQINKNAEQTNKDFGGMEPEVKNIYMTHGSLDPWNPMGHGVAQGATVISNASHCADFGSVSDSDSAELRASKLKLAGLVRQWLAE